MPWTTARACGSTTRAASERSGSDPDLDVLGPDALALTRRELAAALDRRRAPLKAVLLDQTAVAGLGNLLVDELLWWAGSTLGARRGR